LSHCDFTLIGETLRRLGTCPESRAPGSLKGRDVGKASPAAIVLGSGRHRHTLVGTEWAGRTADWLRLSSRWHRLAYETTVAPVATIFVSFWPSSFFSPPMEGLGGTSPCSLTSSPCSRSFWAG
jgi:hypothetical protein